MVTRSSAMVDHQQFLLFGGETYYPKGGALDYMHSADDVQALKDYHRKYLTDNSENIENRWAMIVRRSDMAILEVGGSFLASTVRRTSHRWRPYDPKEFRNEYE